MGYRSWGPMYLRVYDEVEFVVTGFGFRLRNLEFRASFLGFGSYEVLSFEEAWKTVIWSRMQIIIKHKHCNISGGSVSTCCDVKQSVADLGRSMEM